MSGGGAPLGPAAGEPGRAAPEVRLRPSDRERLRGALSAAGTVALLMIPVGLVLGLLTGSLLWLVVLEFWAVFSAGLSYAGQGHNAVFVSDKGIRRVFQSCSVSAPWAGLSGVEVTIPGQRIVVFRVNAADCQVQRVGWGGRRAAEALRRNPPDGFKLRLDRATADALVTMIRARRPDLPGLSSWEQESRPEPPAGRG